MKLRLQGNSVRLRLTRSEVERLHNTGNVEEFVDFGGSNRLLFRLRSRADSGPVQAEFKDLAFTVSVGAEAAQAWTGSDDVGIYAQSESLTVSIEKDFRCLTRPLDDPQERDAFPHPGERKAGTSTHKE
jgi:hypothetical protein